jgi:hypothetical protein
MGCYCCEEENGNPNLKKTRKDRTAYKKKKRKEKKNRSGIWYVLYIGRATPSVHSCKKGKEKKTFDLPFSENPVFHDLFTFPFREKKKVARSFFSFFRPPFGGPFFRVVCATGGVRHGS